MPWAKVDDHFFENSKVIELSKDAKLLYLATLTKCAAQLTDGFISLSLLRISAALVDVPVSVSTELVDAGLWEQGMKGFQIHDYLAYNPSSERVRHERAQTAKRQRDYIARAQQNNPNNNGVSDGVINDNPVPVPVPVPVSNTHTPNNSMDMQEVEDAKNGADAPVVVNTHEKRKRKPKAPLEFAEDSDAFKLAQHLKDCILQNDPKCQVPQTPTQLQKWAKEMDYLTRFRPFSSDEVRAIIEFSQTDSFWRQHVFTATYLKEKFDKLRAKHTGLTNAKSNGGIGVPTGFTSNGYAPKRIGQAPKDGEGYKDYRNDEI